MTRKYIDENYEGFDEVYDRFEETHKGKYQSFEELLEDFTIWGGKKVLPTLNQIKALRIVAEREGKTESYIVYKEWFKNGRFFKRFVDMRTGRFAKARDYQKQFGDDY